MSEGKRIGKVQWYNWTFDVVSGTTTVQKTQHKTGILKNTPHPRQGQRTNLLHFLKLHEKESIIENKHSTLVGALKNGTEILNESKKEKFQTVRFQ